ncbi:MAG TPA: hypothetical protein VIH89_14315 [Candidatus Sulfotelmatobacter sp.]
MQDTRVKTMKKIAIRLCILAVMSGVYSYGSSLSSNGSSNRQITPNKPVCCTAGNGAKCCGPNTCNADQNSCGAA